MRERVVTERADKKRAFWIGVLSFFAFVILAGPALALLSLGLPPGPGTDAALGVVYTTLAVAGLAILWVKAGRWALLGVVAIVLGGAALVVLLVGLCAVALGGGIR